MEHLGRIEIDAKSLVELLRFPEGTRIVRMQISGFLNQKLDLVVEHKDLAKVAVGAFIPIYNPTYFDDGTTTSWKNSRRNWWR